MQETWVRTLHQEDPLAKEMATQSSTVAWKIHGFDQTNFVGKVMSLLFNMLSRLIITFLLRSQCLNFMVTVTICSDFGAQKNKV